MSTREQRRHPDRFHDPDRVTAEHPDALDGTAPQGIAVEIPAELPIRPGAASRVRMSRDAKLITARKLGEQSDEAMTTLVRRAQITGAQIAVDPRHTLYVESRLRALVDVVMDHLGLTGEDRLDFGADLELAYQERVYAMIESLADGVTHAAAAPIIG
jgi:hypothetical protein